MRHLAALILSTLLLAGCGSRHGGRPVTVTPFIGPDGSSRWLALKCKRGMGDCYAEVGDWCPSGYDVGDKAQSSESSGGFSASKGAASGSWSSSTSHELIVRCKQMPADPHGAEGPDVWTAYQ